MESLVTNSTVQAILEPLMMILGVTDAWAAVSCLLAAVAVIFFLAWIVGALRRRSLKRELVDACDYADALETLMKVNPVGVSGNTSTDGLACEHTIANVENAQEAQKSFHNSPAGVVENPSVCNPNPQTPAFTGANSALGPSSSPQNLTQTVHEVIKANVTGNFAAVGGFGSPESVPAQDSSQQNTPSTCDDVPRAMLSGRIPRV